MPFISIRNCNDLLDQVCCPWDNMTVPRWRTFKILKLNVWTKSKELFHISTSFLLHLEKSLGLWEVLIDTANMNWIQTRNWKVQKTNIQSIVLLRTHPSFPQTPSSTSKTMQQSKTDEIVFLQRQWVVTIHLNLDQCLCAYICKPKYLSKRSNREYMCGFFHSFQP